MVAYAHYPFSLLSASVLDYVLGWMVLIPDDQEFFYGNFSVTSLHKLNKFEAFSRYASTQVLASIYAT